MGRERPFEINPEDKSRLETMGHDSLMENLAKKYPQVEPGETESSPELSPEDRARFEAMGGSAILEQLKQRQNALIRELEQLPKYRETYTKQEVEAIIDVEKQLQGFIDNFNQVTKDLAKESPRYREICNQYIDQVLQYLDQTAFWTYKFTTENAGGASSDQPLEHSADDSVYYVTQSGISLRLKRSASDLGLRTVIQPFYEKIIFGLPDSDLKEDKPQVGSRVIEYRSNEFHEILKSGKVSQDFESPNEIYTKTGKIFFVASNDPRPHVGDRVNQLLEAK
jgi:hypothetical protein